MLEAPLNRRKTEGVKAACEETGNVTAGTDYICCVA